MSREKSIIFNSEMVKAILEGQKTQTRRPVKLKKNQRIGTSFIVQDYWDNTLNCVTQKRIDSPYGKVGDRLWVRETFRIWRPSLRHKDTLQYKVDSDKWIKDPGNPWKPSIHMPRWASRITLEITDVRVERLKNMSYEDMLKEGLELKTYLGAKLRGRWIYLWNSVYKKTEYKWQNNPLVWVIDFKRLEMDK